MVQRYVTGDEWGPLKVVGAFKSGDAGDEGGGHFEKGWFWNKRRQQTFNNGKQRRRWCGYTLHDTLRA